MRRGVDLIDDCRETAARTGEAAALMPGGRTSSPGRSQRAVVVRFEQCADVLGSPFTARQSSIGVGEAKVVTGPLDPRSGGEAVDELPRSSVPAGRSDQQRVLPVVDIGHLPVRQDVVGQPG